MVFLRHNSLQHVSFEDKDKPLRPKMQQFINALDPPNLAKKKKREVAMAQLPRKEYLCTRGDYGLIDSINILRR